jgi:hypothetical protein
VLKIFSLDLGKIAYEESVKLNCIEAANEFRSRAAAAAAMEVLLADS